MIKDNTIELRAAVIGYGAYGRIHASKYQQLPGVTLAAVVDNNSDSRRQAAQDLPNVAIMADPRELSGHVDLASVVVPAAAHVAVARELLEAGIHLLIEKPITTHLSDADLLIQLARHHKRVLQGGHLERFNGALEQLHRHIPNPRYIEARRMTSWRNRGADVNVILDLMIHDIDMLLTMVDSPILDIRARGVRVFTSHWDVANAQIRFANGCLANLTASRASPVPERRLHVFAEQACALVNLDTGELILHQTDRSTAGHEATVVTESRYCRHDDPLGAEIAAFIAAVDNGTPPLVSGEDSRDALDIALRITEAMTHDDDFMDWAAAPYTDSAHAIAFLMKK